MDHLRQGIGLRGYGQKDPKQEYKKEGYEGFIQMLGAIKAPVRQPDDARASRATRRRRRAAPAADGSSAQRRPWRAAPAKKASAGAAGRAAAGRGARRPQGRPQRPCPCGSGKKYKKCHGATETV